MQWGEHQKSPRTFPRFPFFAAAPRTKNRAARSHTPQHVLGCSHADGSVGAGHGTKIPLQPGNQMIITKFMRPAHVISPPPHPGGVSAKYLQLHLVQ